MNTNHQATDGVDRANALPQAVEVPAPPQHPVDAASVLTPELLDRDTAALPPVWQVCLVGLGLSVLAGVGVMLLFLPAGRRSSNAQVPLRSVSQPAAGLDAEPTSGDFHCDPHSSRTASRLDRTAGGFDVETPAVRVFKPSEVRDA